MTEGKQALLGLVVMISLALVLTGWASYCNYDSCKGVPEDSVCEHAVP